MSNIVALDRLIDTRQVWRGQSANLAPSSQSTGHAALDAALPTGGWPEAALSELLLPANGVGELELLWPALARLSQDDALHGGRMIVLIDPPFVPYAPAWRDAGVAPARLQWVRAQHRDALWAAEQCLRSGACAAVLCWPQRADDRALRRLQVAAETGQCLGFALRDSRAALNPSPAALRIAIDTAPRQLRVLKCRGGNAPARPIAFAHGARDAMAAAAARIETIRSESEPGRSEPAVPPPIRLAAQPSPGARVDPARPDPSPARPAPVLTLRPR
ncbi:putative cell division inhibitor protein [Lysobacter antibioticus]|uniref:Putative cell division inhibitor protein n=1 Tax=Lysobacter antibioticus TaxID=84531 RepID=A0A0S2FC09_LYSAN|nr:putative cell division inhibitor protein [Lysobacter antibioticus]